MNEYLKPLPTLSDENRPFWDACRAHELRMQRCTACGHIRFPISRICPKCLDAAHTWQPLSGRGTVFSYVVFHQVYNAAFKQDVPYNVALVELEEGPRLITNMLNDPASLVGDALVVLQIEQEGGQALARFRLAAGTA